MFLRNKSKRNLTIYGKTKKQSEKSYFREISPEPEYIKMFCRDESYDINRTEGDTYYITLIDQLYKD